MVASIQLIAEAYEQAPTFHNVSDVRRAWRELAAETMVQALKLRSCLDVRFTADPEPYALAYDMLRDISQGRIVISTANCAHPVWSADENVAFRLVHDVIGHGTTGAGFTWDGEVRAYEKHVSTLRSPLARAALFTEALGQVAYALLRGGFGEQKVALLPQWMAYEGPAHGVAA